MNKAKTKKIVFSILFFLGVLQIHSQTNVGSLPQLKVWLRADSLVTLNVDSTISTWKDIKGGYNFAPSSAPQAPSVKPGLTDFNFHAYANFGGNKGLLSQSNVALKNNKTTILLIGELNTPNFFGHWVCYGTNSGGNWNFREVNTSGRLSLINSSDNTGAGVNSGNPAGNTTVLNTHSAAIMATIDPVAGQWSIFENFSNKHTSNGPFAQAANSPISIGYRTDAGLYANFKMAELMIFDSTLSLTQFETVKKYLQKRYSKEVSLGADITVAYGFCDTALKVKDPAFGSFLWSTGDTTQSITIKKAGSYWVDVVDVYGLHSRDTVTVKYPTIPVISNATLCPGDSIVWDTHLSKKGYTFLWQNNSTDSLMIMKLAGNYLVKITDSLGCSWVSDTVKIKVDGISNQISLGGDTSFCAGNTIGLIKGASNVTSYLWSTGSTANKITILTSGKYWLTVKSINNCTATDTINVVVTGTAPTADFSFSGTCLKNATVYTDLSTVASGQQIISWQWNFGDSFTSTLQQPMHLYADTNKYTVQLKVKTLAGCESTTSKFVKIYPRPKLNFTVSNPYKNVNASFAGTAITYGYTISSWKWNFGDPLSGSSNTSVLQKPDHLFANIGTYAITLTAANVQGCADTLNRNVLIESIVYIGVLPQLKVWLRADTLVTLNSDSTIHGWKDIVKGTDFAPSATPQSPLLKENLSLMNNKPYANFNGNNSLLSQGPVSLKNNLTTILLVGQINTPTNFGHLVCYGVNGPGNWNLREIKNTGHLSFINAENNLGAGLDATGNPVSTTSVQDKNPTIIMATVNPVNYQWSLFEKLVNKHAVFTSPFSLPPSAVVSIGYRTDAGLFSDFKMAELMIFDSVITESQFTSVKNYLQNRYSKKVSLGDDITVSYGFCDTLLKVSNPLFTSYKWSTGDTTKSIATHKTGSYWVDVVDIYGFHSADTIKISYPALVKIPNSTICQGDSVVWDTHLSKKGYTFLWQNNSTDSLLVIKQAGKYTVKVTDNLGCSIISDTVTIKADGITTQISLGGDTIFCSGNKIGLIKGAANVVSYLWSTGSMNTTIPIITSGKYWLTVKSLNNCPATDTINVVVSGVAPVSDFSFINTCLKNTTRFTDLSVPPAGEMIASWNWDFGDSFLSSTQNPTHVYADTGIYKVKLLVTTLAGCSELHTQTVHIYPRPKLSFSANNLCEGIGTSFTSQAILSGYPVTLWSWNFADPASGSKNISALQNPDHLFANAGIYPVTLIAENNKSCTDTLIKNIIINATPVTDFSFSLPCKDVAVLFKDLTVLPAGTTNTANYWSFGNGTSTQLNPTHTFSANVKYNVMHVVTASNGCKDTIIKSVDVHATPKTLFTNSNSCEMNPTAFTDLSLISAGSITGWQWTFENKGNSILKNPQYSFVKAGNAIVKHVVISDFGCKDSLTKTIVVYPKPLARFTNSPEYGNPGQIVTFTNTSIGAISYLWNFDDGATSTVVNPAHLYAAVGSYLPSLVATSSIGCTDTSFGSVVILKRFMDVAITGITAQVQNGGGALLNNYLTVRVNILNKSTADVFALDLYLETSDGAAIKESWTGKLLKGNSMSYDFKAAPPVKAGDHFICVDVLNPNGLKDEIPVDNKVCEALDVSVFKVLAPYPNPADDVLIIPLIIPEEGELDMTIYDANGKEMEKMFSGSVAQGLQLMTLNTRIFNAGSYVCKVQLGGQTLFTKFIKK